LRRLSPRYSSSPALRIEPRLSPRLWVLALTLAVAGAASVLWSATPAWLGVPLCVLAGLSICVEVSRLHQFCGSSQVCALVYERGRWSLQLHSGEYCPLELIAMPLQSEWLLAARFRRQDNGPGCFRLFLLPDMIDAEAWRRVSLALRQNWEGESG
jgi:hypothetical protein